MDEHTGSGEAITKTAQNGETESPLLEQAEPVSAGQQVVNEPSGASSTEAAGFTPELPPVDTGEPQLADLPELPLVDPGELPLADAQELLPASPGEPPLPDQGEIPPVNLKELPPPDPKEVQTGIALPVEPFGLSEWLLVIVFILTGFLVHEFSILTPELSGIGTTICFLLPLFSSLAYLRHRKIACNWFSCLLFVLALLGALPFTLHGSTPTYFTSLFFETCLCLFWLASSCQNLIAKPLSWLLAFDWVNQFFVVPVANIKPVFLRMFTTNKTKRALFTVLIILLVSWVTLPLFCIVFSLLSSSDEGFVSYTNWLVGQVSFQTTFRWMQQLLLALPIAVFLLTVVIGNAYRQRTTLLKRSQLLSGFQMVSKLPHASLVVPFSLFLLFYLAYLVVVGKALFLVLSGQLPDGFNYAEYARGGFFELVTVAFINAFLVAVLWSLAKRSELEYPSHLRFFTGLFSLLTVLLMVIDGTKMFLYVQSYNLTLLRFYAGFFMVVLAIGFLLLLAWCFKSHNVARQIIALLITAFLAVNLVNPPALIANFNTERYLTGATDKMDTSELASYGLVSVPALERLVAEAPDLAVRQVAINDLVKLKDRVDTPQHWYGWNLYDQLAGNYD